MVKECIKIRTKYAKLFKKCFPFGRGGEGPLVPSSVMQEFSYQNFESLPILMNGSKIISESFEKYDIKPRWVFYDGDRPPLELVHSVQQFPVMSSLINHICGDIVSNDGYCAVYDNYNPYKLFRPKKRNLYMYCYKVTDPNNLGSLIRMAFGFNVSAIFLSDDCVSPFTERSIRSSRNYVLNIPIFHLPLQDYNKVINQQLKCGTSLIADASSESKIAIGDLKLKTQNTCLVLGNEHNGFSDDLQAISEIDNHQFVYIPMKNNIDSFSVSHAGSILLYELSK